MGTEGIAKIHWKEPSGWMPAPYTSTGPGKVDFALVVQAITAIRHGLEGYTSTQSTRQPVYLFPSAGRASRRFFPVETGTVTTATDPVVLMTSHFTGQRQQRRHGRTGRAGFYDDTASGLPASHVSLYARCCRG